MFRSLSSSQYKWQNPEKTEEAEGWAWSNFISVHSVWISWNVDHLGIEIYNTSTGRTFTVEIKVLSTAYFLSLVDLSL